LIFDFCCFHFIFGFSHVLIWGRECGLEIDPFLYTVQNQVGVLPMEAREMKFGQFVDSTLTSTPVSVRFYFRSLHIVRCAYLICNCYAEHKPSLLTSTTQVDTQLHTRARNRMQARTFVTLPHALSD
jgi:hypothetical protein